MSSRVVDLRSDTVTRPTPAMRKAMYDAEVGDDVIGDDPTVQALESLGAEMVGQEASLFVPSGTFGNQCALFAHCPRGSEVILPEGCHIVQHEAGAAAVIAGVQLRTVRPALASGVPLWSELEERVRRTQDIHYPFTALVAYENALSGGEVAEPGHMREIAAGSHAWGIPVHLDGARLFNAAACLGVGAAELARHVDSVMFCLSKGLCAPVGSLLAGTKEFVQTARRKRKIMGGGMRQVGILAAAGLVSLREMVRRLAEDHEKATLLASAFAQSGELEVQPQPVRINMFFVRFRAQRARVRAQALVGRLGEHGVLTYGPEDEWVRFVTHHDVTFEDVRYACQVIPAAMEQLD